MKAKKIENVLDLLNLVRLYLRLESRIILLRSFISSPHNITLVSERIRLTEELNQIEPEFLRLHETLNDLVRKGLRNEDQLKNVY